MTWAGDLLWAFDVSPETMVVTTVYVTGERMPVLCVTHEPDEEDGVLWQFHCGNGDYRASVLQLVRFDEIAALDAAILQLAALPLGSSARRASVSDEWVIEPIV
jgi:hypothetical protein